MSARGDESFINKFPDDAAQMALIVRRADEITAVRLMQVWGSKQRDIGSIKALETVKEMRNAQA